MISTCSCGQPLVTSNTGTLCLTCDIPSQSDHERLAQFCRMQDDADEFVQDLIERIRRYYRDGES